MKYIPVNKLIAEIERRMNENCELGKKAECFSHRAVEDNDILALIDSLQQEQPEVDLGKAARYVYESWMGGTMDDVRRNMVELGKVLNAKKED